MWTFESDSRGYMLFYDGKPQGGARSMGTATHTSWGTRRHWRHVRADRAEHHATAKRECDRRNAAGTVPAGVVLREDVAVRAEDYGDPSACPWCKGENITYITGWSGMTSDDDAANKVDLNEYQCADCGNRSFWV